MFSVDPFFLMDHMTISLKLAANFHGLSGCQGRKHSTQLGGHWIVKELVITAMQTSVVCQRFLLPVQRVQKKGTYIHCQPKIWHYFFR